MTTLCAKAGEKTRIAFANPHNLDRDDGKATVGKSRDRKNLSVKLSYDEGQTWPVNKTLEPSWSGYSDLAVLPCLLAGRIIRHLGLLKIHAPPVPIHTV